MVEKSKQIISGFHNFSHYYIYSILTIILNMAFNSHFNMFWLYSVSCKNVLKVFKNFREIIWLLIILYYVWKNLRSYEHCFLICKRLDYIILLERKCLYRLLVIMCELYITYMIYSMFIWIILFLVLALIFPFENKSIIW